MIACRRVDAEPSHAGQPASIPLIMHEAAARVSISPICYFTKLR
jgi:hypothetical protein